MTAQNPPVARTYVQRPAALVALVLAAFAPSGASAAPSDHPAWPACVAASTCRTVCPAGCNFTSPQACLVGLGTATHHTCLTFGGTYHEEVRAAFGYLHQGLRFECAAGERCVVDGDNVRASAFVAYNDWQLVGFEVRNTTGDALTSIASRPWSLIERCHIHDVGGSAIAGLGFSGGATGAVATGNLIERVRGHGIFCASATLPIDVSFNVVVNAALEGGAYRGIQCTPTGSTVRHNTVLTGYAEPPLAGSTGYAILAYDAFDNVAVGGQLAAIRVNNQARGNVTWDAPVGVSLAAGATEMDNVHADPLLLSREDLHLSAGSPAIVSTGPDKGAWEYDPAYVAQPLRWPVREQLTFVTAGESAAPALAHLPGTGPAIAFRTQAAKDLRVSFRELGGGWRAPEIVDAPVSVPSPTSLRRNTEPLDLEVEPVSQRLALAWVEEVGTHRVVRYAVRTGDACGTGCTSPHWSGCDEEVLRIPYVAANVMVDLEFNPVTGEPAIAVRHDSANCPTTIEYVERLGNGTWQASTVTVEGCGFYLTDFDFDFRPDGVAALAWSRVDLSKAINSFNPNIYGHGDLFYATRSGGGFAVEAVDLRDALWTVRGVGLTYLALRHDQAGIPAIAFSSKVDWTTYLAQWGATLEGIGYSPKDAGVSIAIREVGGWEPRFSLIPAMTHPVTGTGVGIAWDAAGKPWVASIIDRLLWLSDRLDGTWTATVADPYLQAGGWLDLLAFNQADLMLAHQEEPQTGLPRAIRFQATADPGGRAPGDVDPLVCDLCPGDPAKTVPGLCGCGVPDTDTDGDGTADCNDPCPSDPAKVAPGTCGCGVAETDTDGDGTADCNDACPNDPAKVAPGTCGCGVADTDTDDDGIADCDEAPEPNDGGSGTEPGVKVKPGCGCSTEAGSSAAAPWGLLLAGLFIGTQRRRRSRTLPQPADGPHRFR